MNMENHASQQNTSEPGRVARRRARVRADLLAAARRVFTEHGYQDATISEIVQIADVAMGTFYLHFHDKEELLTALVREAQQMIREKIHLALAQQAGELLIPLIIRTLLWTAYEQRDLFLLMCAGESHLLVHTATSKAQEGLAEHFIPILQKAKEMGQLEASDDPALLAHLLVGLLMRAISWWFEQDEPGPDAMAERILSLLAHGLPNALLAGKEHPMPL